MKSFIKTYLDKTKEIIDSVDVQEVMDFINLLKIARENERTIFIMGNGGSGALASHFVCDFNKSIDAHNGKKFKFICLNDNTEILMAYANDMSYDDVFVEQLKNFLKPDDIVIGISTSGNSKNVLKAIEYANQKGAKTVGLTGSNGGKLKQTAKSNIHINSKNLQIAEDIQLNLCHLIMHYFMEVK